MAPRAMLALGCFWRSFSFVSRLELVDTLYAAWTLFSWSHYLNVFSTKALNTMIGKDSAVAIVRSYAIRQSISTCVSLT